MKVAFATLGCKVNHYESQAISEQFQKAGWEILDFDEIADVYCINTCSVTAMSDKKSRQLISQAHRKNPDAFIVVAGCYSQVEPDKTLELPGVGMVIGNTGKSRVVKLVEEHLSSEKNNCVNDIRKCTEFESISAVADSRTRATLKIQDGCNNYCSYCIIPYARGPIRSRALEDIKKELSILADKGFSEVVLTGIHIASYGRDFHGGANTGENRLDLLKVLQTANETPGILRVRMGSLEPIICEEDFVRETAKLDHVCKQFHLALQSGSDTVLKRMNRHYTTEEYWNAVKRIRQYMPDAAITTDVITGFVGETEEEFEETCSFIREIGFARTHVFPYSRRPGTVADRMEGHLEKSVKEARTAKLIEIGETCEKAFIDRMIGTKQTVIVENDGTGYTDNYIRVRCGGSEGEIKDVILTGRDGLIAIGE